jgi:predicted transcriptional regulator
MQKILLGIAVAVIGLKLLGKNDNFSNTWIENSRNNNNYKTYPPCFNLSNEAQKIYDILESKNMIEKHKILFEVYSILFCQIKYLKIKNCSNTMLLDRINDLEKLTVNINISNYKNLIKYVSQSNIANKNNSTLKFLELCAFLISKEIDKINLSQNEISLIIELNNNICSNFFQTIVLNC